MAVLFILLPAILILVGIYKLFAKLIDRGGNKRAKSYDRLSAEQKTKEIDDNAKSGSQKLATTIADKCPTCGGPVEGSEEKCRYCGMAIPQNVLFNKEKAMEQKSLELNYQMTMMAANSKEKKAEKLKKIAEERDKSKRIKRLIFLLLILFILYIMLKRA